MWSGRRLCGYVHVQVVPWVSFKTIKVVLAFQKFGDHCSIVYSDKGFSENHKVHMKWGLPLQRLFYMILIRIQLAHLMTSCTAVLMHLSVIAVCILLGTDRSRMPLQFSHFLTSPFFGSLIMSPVPTIG